MERQEEMNRNARVQNQQENVVMGGYIREANNTVEIWSWDHRSQENNIEKTSLSRSAYG